MILYIIYYTNIIYNILNIIIVKYDASFPLDALIFKDFNNSLIIIYV